MFKKLASLLFNEEEIIIEEEIAKQDKEDALKIPELKPIVPQKKQEVRDTRQTNDLHVKKMSIEDKPRVENKPESSQDEAMKKKIVMINVDEKKPERKRIETPIRERAYQSQEVISPIFGGTQETTNPIKKPVTDAKKRTSMTQVISPMFGHVSVEESEEIEQIDEIMDLDITEMLSPGRSEEEVQVSLYDFLEGLDDDDTK